MFQDIRLLLCSDKVREKLESTPDLPRSRTSATTTQSVPAILLPHGEWKIDTCRQADACKLLTQVNSLFIPPIFFQLPRSYWRLEDRTPYSHREAEGKEKSVEVTRKGMR